jgi:hypothetical protein
VKDYSHCDRCKVGERDIHVGQAEGFFADTMFCHACAYKQGLVKYGIFITTMNWATEDGGTDPIVGSKEEMKAMAEEWQKEASRLEEQITYEVLPIDTSGSEKKQ